jgi:hypothetical protein
MKHISGLLALACLILLPGFCQAALTNIGTANLSGSIYNLILDDDSLGNSVIWLDYSNGPASYDDQMDWAAGLDAALTDINTPGRRIVWQEDAWRLPDTVDGERDKGYDGSTTAGYRITSSELGYLHMTTLGNEGWRTEDGSYIMENINTLETDLFENLVQEKYWSGTVNEIEPDAPGLAWYYQASKGYQDLKDQSSEYYGIALRSAVVVPVSDVPLPAGIWFLGSGLLSLVAALKP